MLPPELADFAFRRDDAGSDTALAARVRASTGGKRVCLLGAGRIGLLRALTEMGLGVVVVDSARSVLLRVRAELGDEADSYTLLAQDPRELEIPGGVDAVLVTSVVWRAVILPEDRVHVARAIAKNLDQDGVLCMDVERVPEAPIGQPETLREEEGRRITWCRPSREWDLISIRSSPLDDPELSVPLDLAGASPERCMGELHRAGLVVHQMTNAVDGSDVDPTTERLWVVARRSPLARTIHDDSRT